MELNRPSVGMLSLDGTLSPDKFYEAACAFADRWKKYNAAFPPWSWFPSTKFAANNVERYLLLGNVVLPKSAEEDDREDECGCPSDNAISNGDEVIDDAILVESKGRGTHKYDFRIVYSTSYDVPVLYLRAYYSYGQPLAFGDIVNDISANFGDVLKGPSGTPVTVEDPYLNQQWYMLHLCGTSDWEKLFSSTETSATTQKKVAVEKYVDWWFTEVGQLFGLKVPLEMLGNGISAS